MGICSAGGQTNGSLTLSLTLDHQLMEFSTRHWPFVIASTLVGDQINQTETSQNWFLTHVK